MRAVSGRDVVSQHCHDCACSVHLWHLLWLGPNVLHPVFHGSLLPGIWHVGHPAMRAGLVLGLVESDRLHALSRRFRLPGLGFDGPRSRVPIRHIFPGWCIGLFPVPAWHGLRADDVRSVPTPARIEVRRGQVLGWLANGLFGVPSWAVLCCRRFECRRAVSARFICAIAWTNRLHLHGNWVCLQ